MSKENALPEEFHEIFQRLAHQYDCDIKRAVKEAEKEITEHPRFIEFRDALVLKAIQEGIYGARHSIKRSMKQVYVNEPVRATTSASVMATYEEVYNMPLGGGVLGDLTYEQLRGSRRRNGRSREGTSSTPRSRKV